MRSRTSLTARGANAVNSVQSAHCRTTIRGMTVLTSDGASEAVVVNLMGNIQPEQFGDGMVALDVDASARPGAYAVRAELGYQMCDEKTCLAPKTIELDNTLHVVSASSAITRVPDPAFDTIVFSGAPVATPPSNSWLTSAPVAPTVDCDVVAAHEQPVEV